MCDIQWINDKGEPTPDDNPPIGRVRCKMYTYEGFNCIRKPWVEGDYTAWFSICAEHVKVLNRPDMADWELEPLRDYEVTFVRQNGEWTWTYFQALDFQDAMTQALVIAPTACRVHSIVFMTAEQITANKKRLSQRWA